ncbi:hypothetical protein [Streptomyces hygroscopicus]|uniref:hypothetical protein n=1 Tax=Streptomyces hygroscopicus TaxID=1912 RepID=UPI001FCBA1BC|nr:hypothetical protein [Streptomyces hygroscopicus]BDH13403.1 hypothetical protein HOK021_45820 [Streptomyces hygroscopicus]
MISRQFTAVLPVIDVLRTEVRYVQYLEVTATGTATADLERALEVVRYRTARHSVEHLLHLPHPGRDIRHHHTGGAARTRSLIAYGP